MTVFHAAHRHVFYPGSAGVPEPVPFPFLSVDHLRVALLRDGLPPEPFSRDIDYVIGGDGRSVRVLRSLGPGDAVEIARDTPLIQDTQIVPHQPLPGESVERSLDRSTMSLQEMVARLLDMEARTLRVPIGETIPPVASALARAGRLQAYDAFGRPALAPGSAGQLAADLSAIIARLLALEEAGQIMPTAVAAADWSALPNLARKIREAAYRGGDQPPVEIVLCGIGSSVMRGGGTIQRNTAINVLLRQAKAKLDPNGICAWRAVNYGANSTNYVNFDSPDSTDPADPTDLRTIRQKVVDLKPDLLLVGYGMNDGALEQYVTGQTRDYIPIGVDTINRQCAAIGCDVIHMTEMHPHIGKKSAVNAGGRSGNMVNAGIQMGYPRRSWQYGQGLVTPFTVSAATKRITSSIPGLFNDTALGFGLAVGKVVVLTDPDLKGNIANPGYFRITAKDPSGNWIEIATRAAISEFGAMVDVAPAVLVSETAPMAIRRVDIDPETEQQPPVSKSVVPYYAYTGAPAVAALQTYLDINSDIRRAVAVSEFPCACIDIEASYLIAKLTYSEDRWYAANEVVHRNDQFVIDVLEPLFAAFVGSLGPVERVISTAGRPRFVSSQVVRPTAIAGSKLPAGDAPDRDDVQLLAGERSTVRDRTLKPLVRVNEATGRLELFHYLHGQVAGGRSDPVRLRFDGGYSANVRLATPLVIQIPPDCAIEVFVSAYRPDVGKAEIRIGAVRDRPGGPLLDAAAIDVDVGATINANPVTVTKDGTTIKIAGPDNAAGVLVSYSMRILPQHSTSDPVVP